jgi:hypothetical protein
MRAFGADHIAISRPSGGTHIVGQFHLIRHDLKVPRQARAMPPWMLRLSWTTTMGLGAREVTIGQVFQDVSVGHGGMAIRDFDMAPAFERCKHHKEVGGAVALV